MSIKARIKVLIELFTEIAAKSKTNIESLPYSPYFLQPMTQTHIKKFIIL